MIQDIQQWRNIVLSDWDNLYQNTKQLALGSFYEDLLAIALLPALPKTQDEIDRFIDLIQTERYTKAIVERFHIMYSSVSFSQLTLSYVVRYIVNQSLTRPAELQGLDRLLLATGVLIGSQRSQAIDSSEFVERLLSYLYDNVREASAIRVQAEMIHAGQNVIIAGHDVNIVSTYFSNIAARLKTYVGALRAEWNQPDLGRILPDHYNHSNGSVRLHQLYTNVDVWGDVIYTETDPEKLAELRYSAIEKDKSVRRVPLLEALSSKPLLVITGAAGTGKTMLARYLAISLAYACDPDAELADSVKGLDLLGPAWIHGVLLPLYVNLRSFASDKDVFPKNSQAAQSLNLLNYLRKKTDALAPELEGYLTRADVQLHGAFLILDGYDEVYNEDDRTSLSKIINQWVEQFPKCRILITSRSYVYRDGTRRKLSDRFVSAELAPYTLQQIQSYVNNWYSRAASLRPANFGGRDVSDQQTQALARNLLQEIVKSENLRQLARQPLLLALLTLIHEGRKKLPERKAELFDETVKLLNRWNPPLEGEHLSAELVDLKLDLVRDALQLLAFDLQRERLLDQRYPSTITRADLTSALNHQEKQSGGLNSFGAPVSLILDYLDSRNGILISDMEGTYRFPHLNIQEYLAACALIEQYNECEMPAHLKPEDPTDGWTFPENVAALVTDDPYRWREVGLFAGSILASVRDQDRRWGLIQALLPQSESVVKKYRKDHSTFSANALFAIYIAAEIWAEVELKPRRVAQNAICKHLVECLEAIRRDERLEERERAQAITILENLILNL